MVSNVPEEVKVVDVQERERGDSVRIQVHVQLKMQRLESGH